MARLLALAAVVLLFPLAARAEEPPTEPPLPAPAEATPTATSAKGRRYLGIGTAGGGGVYGVSPIGSGLGTSSNQLYVLGLLPTIEVRVFLASGTSIDLTVPLGNMISTGAQGGGFQAQADAFVDFDLPIAPSVKLRLGPGVGFAAGSAALATGFNVASGGFRFLLQTGPEFIAANGLLSVAFLARPYFGFSFFSVPAYFGYAGQTYGAFFGGMVGVVSITLNAGD